MSNEHWSRLFFKQPIIAISPLKGGRQHQTDLIELTDGSKWVCKKLTGSTWLGIMNSAQFRFTEVIATHVANKTGYTYAPKTLPIPKRWVEGTQTHLLITPYCKGKLRATVTQEQAFLLGKLLAKLHQLNLPKKGGQAFPCINLPENQSYSPEVKLLVEQSNASLQYDSQNWVVSHRDIHLENIVWKDAEKPHLIDWESAGLIHPFVELIGVAMNSSGLAVKKFEKNLFRATLRGYAQIMGNLPQANEHLWGLIFHSWLLWYAYSLRRNWQEDAEQTLQVIKLIKLKMKELQHLYAD